MIKLLAETPRDQEMIERFQRAYENLRKIVDRQNERIRELEKKLRKQSEDVEEYVKRHLSTVGIKNDKPYEIKPEIMPQPVEGKKPGQKKGHRGFFRKSPERITLSVCRYTDAQTALQG